MNLKSRNGECTSSVPTFPVYGLPNLSASFFSCSACSFNSLARSSASACFWMRYSKSITESVKLRIKPLSRCHLNLFSSISKFPRLPVLASANSGISYRCPATAAYVQPNGHSRIWKRNRRPALPKKQTIPERIPRSEPCL